MTPLVLLSALAFGSGPKTTAVDDSMTVAYFPTLGTRLVYQANVQPGGVEHTVVVSAVAKSASGTCVSLTSLLPNGQTVLLEKVVVSESGVFLTEISMGKLPTPVPLVLLPVKPGSEWHHSDGSRVVTVREEAVTVPAGRVTAVRVESYGPTLSKPTTFWYAPGKGLVRVDLDGKTLLALKSVTSPK